MALSREERAYVVDSACDLLRHRHRGRLIRILERRVAGEDYDDERERELDRVVLAVARVIDAELEAEP